MGLNTIYNGVTSTYPKGSIYSLKREEMKELLGNISMWNAVDSKSMRNSGIDVMETWKSLNTLPRFRVRNWVQV